jgi:hypothetical protein
VTATESTATIVTITIGAIAVTTGVTMEAEPVATWKFAKSAEGRLSSGMYAIATDRIPASSHGCDLLLR